MADEKMAEKKLYRAPNTIGATVDGKIKEMEEEFKDQGPISIGSKWFMPNMNSVSDLGNESTYFKKRTIYKINAPGFIYRHHYSGDWTSKGGIAVYVSSDDNFPKDKTFELMCTYNSNGNGNDHVNNMFPIRPGKNPVYIVILSKGSTRSDSEIGFVPCIGGNAANVSTSKTLPVTALDVLQETRIEATRTTSGEELFRKMFEDNVPADDKSWKN